MQMQLMKAQMEDDREDQMRDELMYMMESLLVPNRNGNFKSDTIGFLPSANSSSSFNPANEALIAKLDVVIEQNRNLQDQIKQGKFNTPPNTNESAAERRPPPRPRRKRKK